MDVLHGFATWNLTRKPFLMVAEVKMPVNGGGFEIKAFQRVELLLPSMEIIIINAILF